MYRGKVIELGTPAELKERMNLPTMEDVFVTAIEAEERRPV
jgi:ABC-type Na+ transport system ATPase subunit NatA